MRILVCGGRDYASTATINAELDALHGEHGITCLIHGTARGADALADAWARRRGIPVTAFPAEWSKHGKAAGFRRNETMLRDGKPELVIAFPGGKGTAHMVRLATAAGVPMKRISNP